ncbi:MAG: putative polymerase subfamily sigma factor [Ilumatobacteraceae bacterium]|nr:putative polymerase subfamily sigma factor [Ilumatobacteraceae bacterium]MCU1388981.1 putative polymerase subfamily sigma factor [Ilumatobacteraceae bacterium]
MDLAIDADSTPGQISPGTATHHLLVGASFEDFYIANRAAVGRALALTLRDAELAADAVDEAMARAYERWTHVETLDNPVGWVYRVGLNWSRSFLRRAGRPTPIWLVTPATAVDERGTDPAVDRALGELSVEQRAVVVCRLLLGYSEAQTAQALGIRPGTVKSRLNRATSRLHVSLAHLHHS